MTSKAKAMALSLIAARAKAVPMIPDYDSMVDFRRKCYVTAAPLAEALLIAIEALEKIDTKCASHDSTASGYAWDALDSIEKIASAE